MKNPMIPELLKIISIGVFIYSSSFRMEVSSQSWGYPFIAGWFYFWWNVWQKWMIWGLFLMTLDTSQWSDGLFWWCEAMLQGRSLLDRMVAILLGEASLDISHISHISQLQTCCFSWNISDGSKLESCEQCGLINIRIIGLMETLCFFSQK